MTPAQPVRCMLSDLLGLLREVPRPDPEYWDELESLWLHQPAVEPSQWES